MPKFTQRMTMHLNGGNDFSALTYEVMKDGHPAGIARQTRTNGSPEYLKTVDVFVAADGSEFDVLATKGEGLMGWLESHAGAAPCTP